MTLDSQEVRTIPEFEALQEARVGWIVNVDKPTKTNRAHRPGCDSMTADAFRTKVVENAGSTGSYYYFLRIDDAERDLGAVLCSRCS